MRLDQDFIMTKVMWLKLGTLIMRNGVELLRECYRKTILQENTLGKSLCSRLFLEFKSKLIINAMALPTTCCKMSQLVSDHFQNHIQFNRFEENLSNFNYKNMLTDSLIKGI